MNANEILSNRAIEMLGGVMGSKQPVHPNDHVNDGAVVDDVIPTATHIAALLGAPQRSAAGAREAHARASRRKAEEFAEIAKTGRTHLMDAVAGHARTGVLGGTRRRFERGHHAASVRPFLTSRSSPSAVPQSWTDLNAPPGLRSERVIEQHRSRDGLAIRRRRPLRGAGRPRRASRHRRFEASPSRPTKIANDLRLIGSGPRAGLSEIPLP